MLSILLVRIVGILAWFQWVEAALVLARWTDQPPLSGPGKKLVGNRRDLPPVFWIALRWKIPV
jgi:hypothetical protein